MLSSNWSWLTHPREAFSQPGTQVPSPSFHFHVQQNCLGLLQAMQSSDLRAMSLPHPQAPKRNRRVSVTALARLRTSNIKKNSPLNWFDTGKIHCYTYLEGWNSPGARLSCHRQTTERSDRKAPTYHLLSCHRQHTLAFCQMCSLTMPSFSPQVRDYLEW